ncbi:MAG: BMP family ABC transporter substrate-binding protein, partial [Firmicutes bacterium]|nr:BMP family ABC transporter substrate-binding protein [Bacillota bacterium]
AGIPNVSYNGSTIASCPNTFIVSSRINWAPYFEYIVNQVAKNEAIATDWTGTIATNSVVLTEVNTNVAAAGTVEAIEAAKAAFVNGELNVFNTALEGFITVGGAPLTSYVADVDDLGDYVPETEVVINGFFHESEFRSAPYFDVQIDGIELLIAKF